MKLLRALTFAVACPLLAPPAFAEDAAEKYYEKILNAEPLQAGTQPGKDGATPKLQEQTDCITCDYDPFQTPTYYLSARGGVSYFDGFDQSRVGGAYSLDLSVRLIRQLSGFASGSFNHYSGGTQFLGVLGLYKTPFPTNHLADRIGWSLMFDQFTDTQFDDLYMSQFRYSLSYALGFGSVAGLSYSDPLTGDRVKNVLAPAATASGGVPVRARQAVDAWVAIVLGDTNLNAQFSYVDGLNSTGYSVGVRQPLGDRTAAFANAQYYDKGVWTAFAGVEFDLGPRRPTASGCGCTASLATRDVARGDEEEGIPYPNDITEDEWAAFFAGSTDPILYLRMEMAARRQNRDMEFEMEFEINEEFGQRESERVAENYRKWMEDASSGPQRFYSRSDLNSVSGRLAAAFGVVPFNCPAGRVPLVNSMGQRFCCQRDIAGNLFDCQPVP